MKNCSSVGSDQNESALLELHHPMNLGVRALFSECLNQISLATAPGYLLCQSDTFSCSR